LIWKGAANQIPSGWVLCDGNNNTPDLRSRFVVGASASGGYSVGAQGGSDSVTLSTSQLPSHTHGDGTLATGNPSTSLTGSINRISECFNAYGNTSGIFTKIPSQFSPITGSSSPSPVAGVSIDATHTHDVTGNTGSAGSGSSHENRPPYYALCYIMKT
jgi:microcystin-dependent protein